MTAIKNSGSSSINAGSIARDNFSRPAQQAAQTESTKAATASSGSQAQSAAEIQAISPRAANRPGEMMLMQYNVENLFDTKDDPKTSDEDFTPTGRNHWNEAKLAYKMQNLGKVIRHVNDGRGPDILTLQEDENKDLLTKLNKTALGGLGYKEPILIEGHDHRGIDVALMTRYPLAGKPKIHEVSDKTWRGASRPILEVPLNVEGKTMTVFVNHWPSKRGGEQAEKERGQAADKLRGLISEKLRKDPKAEILVVGDLNTDLKEKPLSEHLHSGENKVAVRQSTANDPRFYDAMYDAARHHAPQNKQRAKSPVASGSLAQELAQRRTSVATQGLVKTGDPDKANQVGTHYYGRNHSWSTFDHVIMSKGLLDHEGLSYVPGSAQVVHPDFMENRDGSPKRFMPYQKHGRSHNMPSVKSLGYSDHFPVVARFKREQPE